MCFAPERSRQQQSSKELELIACQIKLVLSAFEDIKYRTEQTMNQEELEQHGCFHAWVYTYTQIYVHTRHFTMRRGLEFEGLQIVYIAYILCPCVLMQPIIIIGSTVYRTQTYACVVIPILMTRSPYTKTNICSNYTLVWTNYKFVLARMHCLFKLQSNLYTTNASMFWEVGRAALLPSASM